MILQPRSSLVRVAAPDSPVQFQVYRVGHNEPAKQQVIDNSRLEWGSEIKSFSRRRDSL